MQLRFPFAIKTRFIDCGRSRRRISCRQIFRGDPICLWIAAPNWLFLSCRMGIPRIWNVA